ncbi:MAG: DNA-binding transcriptional LysR family regulator [Gammaproteobacteria bacterium]
MRFTLRQLHYFVAAGDALSIRQASLIINVSEPSISSAISQLESEFGITLFIRHHAQGLSLTQAGIAMLREAKALLQQGHELKHTAEQLTEGVSGHFTVLSFTTLAPFVVPRVCHKFQSVNPNVSLNIREANQAEILDQLWHGKADIAITYDLDLPVGLEFTRLTSLAPYAVLARSHPLAKRKRLSLERLCSEPLVLLDLPLSREYFLSLFQSQNLSPTLLTKTQQVDVMRSIIGQGYGYGLANVRPSNNMTLDGSELVYIPLEGNLTALTLGLLNHASAARSKLAKLFVGHVHEQLEKGLLPGTTVNTL